MWSHGQGSGKAAGFGCHRRERSHDLDLTPGSARVLRWAPFPLSCPVLEPTGFVLEGIELKTH